MLRPTKSVKIFNLENFMLYGMYSPRMLSESADAMVMSNSSWSLTLVCVVMLAERAAASSNENSSSLLLDLRFSLEGPAADFEWYPPDCEGFFFDVCLSVCIGTNVSSWSASQGGRSPSITNIVYPAYQYWTWYGMCVWRDCHWLGQFPLGL